LTNQKIFSAGEEGAQTRKKDRKKVAICLVSPGRNPWRRHYHHVDDYSYDVMGLWRSAHVVNDRQEKMEMEKSKKEQSLLRVNVFPGEDIY